MKVPQQLVMTWAKELGLIDDSAVNPVSPEYLADLEKLAEFAADYGYEACKDDNNIGIPLDAEDMWRRR
jgi:hypothetical protein